jgi:hypothetical protein
MIDTTTSSPIAVSTDGGADPYIVVPVTRLGEVSAILEAHMVPFWVDAEVISIDGKAEIAVVNLGRGANPAAIQGLLDPIPQ